MVKRISVAKKIQNAYEQGRYDERVHIQEMILLINSKYKKKKR